MEGCRFVPETSRLRVVGGGDMADEYDPFATDKKGYSEDKFYTKSTDGKGVSETKYVKMPPSMIGEMGELIARRIIPDYRTDGDFIRDAVIHRLHHIAEMMNDGRLSAVVNRQVMLNENMRVMQDMEECQMIVTTHRDSFEKAVQIKDAIMLEVALDNALGNLDVLRPAYQAELRKYIEDYRRELRRMKDEKK